MMESIKFGTLKTATSHMRADTSVIVLIPKVSGFTKH